MKKKRPYLLSLGFLFLCNAFGANAQANYDSANFIVSPYLQLGNHPKQEKREALELLWISDNSLDTWDVYTKSHNQSQWQKQAPAKKSILSYSVPDKLYLWDSQLTDLEPGEKFQYKVNKNGEMVFKSEAVARKNAQQPFKVILFGDTGAGTLAEKKIVYQSFRKKPDFLVILGDITYSFGRLSEYMTKFYPIFNNPTNSENAGAPILQSTTTLPVIGNHDIAYGANKAGIDFNRQRDALAFYQIWSAPLNGPLKADSEKNIPRLFGSQENINRYLQSTDRRYPTMSNYSFDYGNSHWLVLDANPYMRWTDEAMRNWVKLDLANNKDKTWKFVCFHQPGFSIDKVHNTEQRMRLLSDIFQTYGVDIVFSGHAHNYQRSYPLFFNAKKPGGELAANPDGTVDGGFILDKQFDGKNNIHPQGVIYIVSGAGGAALYGSATHSPDTVNFTDKFDSSRHSFSLCDIKNGELTFSQVSEEGKVLDSFKIKKQEK